MTIIKFSYKGLLFSSPLLFIVLAFFSCRQSVDKPSLANEFVSEVAYPFRVGKQKLKQISAHRGGGDISGYPENCLESMKYIREKTGAWMEIDIRETKDKKLILMHDVSVDRTTDGQGNVKDLTWDEIKKLNLKDNFGRLTSYHPPTLKEVLIWNENEGNTILNLDIKQGVSYRDVLSMVRETNQLDHAVAIVYAVDQAIAMRKLDSEIVISLPVRNIKEWGRLKQSGLPMDHLIAFTGTIRSATELYETLHKNGILTIFGVMGNIDRQAEKRGAIVYQKLYEEGADVLSTDRPLAVFEALKE
jgi:glycerophosphoryl diester phosphodiesterase